MLLQTCVSYFFIHCVKYSFQESVLLHCPALQPVREGLQDMWLVRAAALPELYSVVTQVLRSSVYMRMIFILYPSSMPEIICLCQTYGMPVPNIVYYMCRNYVYGLHRKKLMLTGKWPYSTSGGDSDVALESLAAT